MSAEVEKIKSEYQPGTVIELLADMVEEEGMPAGLRGTVDYVDDIGSIHCKWENRRGLAVIPGVDKYKIIGER